MSQIMFGVLVRHTSTIRPRTEITVERDDHNRLFVRTRTADVITYEDECSTETRARERFERHVEKHYETV